MQKHLTTEIDRIDQIEKENDILFPEFMRRVRMTMIPSIGYFLVVPKVGPKWVHFKNVITTQLGSDIDEQSILEKIMPAILEQFDWKFSFVNDTEIFF